MAEDQLAFDLSYRPALARADFVVAGANADALAWLERWPDWPATAMALTGPPGSGKSHLAQIWREQAAARAIAPSALATASLPTLLGDSRAVLIDDADRAAELPLLHLFNMMAERRGHILLVAREPPGRWGIGVPDLRSRLLTVPVVSVAAPDEVLLGALLVKLFADRNQPVPREVVAFLALRLERSFAAAQEAVAALDRASLSARRRITVPLARGVLALRDEGED